MNDKYALGGVPEVIECGDTCFLRGENVEFLHVLAVVTSRAST